MKIVRFSAPGGTKYGVLEGNTVHGYRGSPYALMQNRGTGFKPDGTSFKLSKVKLLAPCLPSKVVCLGRNYVAHAEEFNSPLPTVPLLFLKPSTCIIGPDDTIVIPKNSTNVDYEGELAVVMGKRARSVPEDRAEEYILGYTCFNDVSERDYQKADVQWTRAKSFDTFGPMGPYIVTGFSPDDSLLIETYLNGKVCQSAPTDLLIFKIRKLVAFITDVMTLLPGDVIATGTPAGVGHIKPGDTVEIKIEKVGTLRNPVAAAVKSS